MLAEELLEKLPRDTDDAILEVCDWILADQHTVVILGRYEAVFERLLTCYLLLKTLIKKSGRDFEDRVDLAGEKRVACHNILNAAEQVSTYIKEHREKQKYTQLIEQTQAFFDTHLSDAFHYEFTDGDLKLLDKLLHEMRTVIDASLVFNDDHKWRLFKKLEALQKELRKKMTSLARFYDLIGDAGVALGRFGKEAKPFADLVEKVLGIAWRTQAKKEELPSDFQLPSGLGLPMLGPGKCDDDSN